MGLIYVLFIFNLLIIVKDEPLREDVVSNDDDDVVNYLDDELTERILETEHGDPDKGNDDVDDQGQGPVEEETEELGDEVTDGRVMGAKYPDFIGEVGD